MAERPARSPAGPRFWLNQIEILFSVIQRKVIKPADFADLAALGDLLDRFEQHYNTAARPFDCQFTSSDLRAMLERLDIAPTLGHVAVAA